VTRKILLALAALAGCLPAYAADRKPLVIVSGQTKQMPTGDTVPVASGGTGATNAAGIRSAAGATTVGGNLITLTNPSAITFLRVNADNTVDALNAASFRTAIGAGTGTGSGDLVAANNLSDVANASTARSNLGLAIGTNVQAYDADLTALGGVTSAADKCPYFTGSGSAAVVTCSSAGRTLMTNGYVTESFCVAVSDETTAITTGTAKVTFRMPYAFTLTAVRASVNTVSSSGLPTFDLKEGGVSVLSTALSIDASEKTSTTAATAAVISDSSLADDAEMTVDITTAGTGAKGAKLCLIGHQ
jgi:hypothetical protein